MSDARAVQTAQRREIDLISKLKADKLALAKTKLQHYVSVTPIKNAGLWDYGVDPVELDELLTVWKHWDPSNSSTMQKLAKFKQYDIVIRGLSIGFIHQVPSCPSKSVIPILLLHG